MIHFSGNVYVYKNGIYVMSWCIIIHGNLYIKIIIQSNLFFFLKAVIIILEHKEVGLDGNYIILVKKQKIIFIVINLKLEVMNGKYWFIYFSIIILFLWRTLLLFPRGNKVNYLSGIIFSIKK